jgi:monomeric sarcosine oxidase
MKLSRREVTKLLLAASLSPKSLGQNSASPLKSSPDAVVIGAGVFGAWTTYFLRKAGLRVTLVDSYGPSNSRASSGGESRIIRASYGADDFYSRWVLRSLPRWQELSNRSESTLFHKTGVLFLSDGSSDMVKQSAVALTRLGVSFEQLSFADLKKRFPQIAFQENDSAILEPNSGALMARRAVQTLVAEMISQGLDYRQAFVIPSVKSGKLDAIKTSTGEEISAGSFIFACGPWLPKMFPAVLEKYVKPERAEVYFLGVPAGDSRFAPPQMPTWIHSSREWDAYGMPDLENRGFKVAVDKISLPADPDTLDREPTPAFLQHVRSFVAMRFPSLKNAPVVETRVCQYEYTPSGNYIIDRHPDFENVWIVGGGSGHGFKNGPAVGEYVTELITKNVPLEPQLTISSQRNPTHRVD